MNLLGLPDIGTTDLITRRTDELVPSNARSPHHRATKMIQIMSLALAWTDHWEELLLAGLQTSLFRNVSDSVYPWMKWSPSHRRIHAVF